MPLLRSSRARFDPERLYRPRSLAVLGEGRLADLVLANIHAGGFPGDVQVASDPASIATADLAILTGQGTPIGDILPALAAKGIYAAVALGLAPDIVEASSATGVMVLGAGSFGVAAPALHLNATLSHVLPRVGRVALVSQSAALCRSILDWAEPNGVGFSQIVGIGGNAGVGFAQTLDFLSRDPAVGPILLDIRRVRNRRAFLSAARAAARLRPVIALRAGSRLIDPSGRAEAVFTAALNRAGVLTVRRLEDLLAAAETLVSAPPLRTESLVIVTNAIGPGQMAADAAISAGVSLTALMPETREVLRLAFPAGDSRDVVYVGVDAPTRIAVDDPVELASQPGPLGHLTRPGVPGVPDRGLRRGPRGVGFVPEMDLGAGTGGVTQREDRRGRPGEFARSRGFLQSGPDDPGRRNPRLSAPGQARPLGPGRRAFVGRRLVEGAEEPIGRGLLGDPAAASDPEPGVVAGQPLLPSRGIGLDERAGAAGLDLGRHDPGPRLGRAEVAGDLGARRPGGPLEAWA